MSTDRSDRQSCPECKQLTRTTDRGYCMSCGAYKKRDEQVSATEKSSKVDTVNHPSHYGGEDNPFEVIKVLERWLTPEEFIGAMKFNVIKYQARARLKNQVEDYEKAAWYATHLISYLKRRESSDNK